MFVPVMLSSAVMAFAGPGVPADGNWPRTRAEHSADTETSTHADVMGFLRVLGAKWDALEIEAIGRSDRGLEIPLVTVAVPPAASGVEARASGRLVVYLQANIHGGEVEGKEAVLMLLRELARGKHRRWLERLVILAAPIYNTDGNEAWGEGSRNRPHQNGPSKVGERHNGGGLDLNRDCMAAQSPEMRAALAHVYRRWDPHVVLDLHTTNGTRHGYALTYAPPLHPDTDPELVAFCREQLLPGVCGRMRSRRGLETFFYGNVVSRDGRRVWSTFGPDPRVVTNYVGLRNRIGILSEATSYLPFRERIEATRFFVVEVLDMVAERRQGIVKLTQSADTRAVARARGGGAEAGVAFESVSRGEEPVLLETPAATRERKPHESPGAIESVLLPVYDRTRVATSARLPAAYLVPASEGRVTDLLAWHGLTALRVRSPVTVRGQVYRIEVSETGAGGGRRARGRFEEAELEAQAGAHVVPLAQPLAMLAFHLLDPEAPSGATAWGLLDTALGVGRDHPIGRLHELPDAVAGAEGEGAVE